MPIIWDDNTDKLMLLVISRAGFSAAPEWDELANMLGEDHTADSVRQRYELVEKQIKATFGETAIAAAEEDYKALRHRKWKDDRELLTRWVEKAEHYQGKSHQWEGYAKSLEEEREETAEKHEEELHKHRERFRKLEIWVQILEEAREEMQREHEEHVQRRIEYNEKWQRYAAGLADEVDELAGKLEEVMGKSGHGEGETDEVKEAEDLDRNEAQAATSRGEQILAMLESDRLERIKEHV